MRHKCDLRTDSIRLFVSSSMHDEVSRELRRALKTFLDRFEFFDCRIVEEVSDGNPVRMACRAEVERADLILLILDRKRREGVIDEFYHAQSLGKEILSFYRPDHATDELAEFTRQEVWREGESDEGITCAEFHQYDQLFDLIEKNLLVHLAQKYKGLLKQVEMYRRETKGLGTTPGVGRDRASP